MTRLSAEIISFDDAGADDNHPVKGITMGHIRRWFDQVEEYETSLRVVAEAMRTHRAEALQELADIDRDLIGHDETMANLDALTIRTSPLSSNHNNGEN